MERDHHTDIYRECLRNHAASLGSYATDGCGEFTFDYASGSLNCVACGCHRNFHRKVARAAHDLVAAEAMEYSIGGPVVRSLPEPESSNKKRFRTKFTEEQKEKMLGFAEKLGWRLQRKADSEEDEIERFCREMGISRKVFKVWMHNHKNCPTSQSPSAGNAANSSLTDK